MRASVRQSFCRPTVSIVVIALAIVAAFALVPQAQAGELIAAQSTGVASQYALLKSDGYLVPCNSSGVELSDTWSGDSATSVINSVHTVLIDPDVRSIGETYLTKYDEDHFGNNYISCFSSDSASVNSGDWMKPYKRPGLPKLSTVAFLSGSKCTAISSETFKNASNLSLISLPDTIVSIGDEAFSGCTSLYKIDLGGSLRSIGAGSFRDCTSLTEIDLPATFSTLNSSNRGASFDGAGLTKVTMRSAVPVSDGEGGKYIWKAFSNTPIVQAGAAYIYVPTSVLTAYRTHHGTDGEDGDGWSYFNQGHLDKLRGIDGEPTSITGATITVSPTSYIYDGAAKRPSVTVRYGSATLVNGKQYAVSYKNNVNAGTATVVVTGIGLYAGTIAKTFTINKAEQPMSVTGKTVKVKRSKKAKILAAAKVLDVSNARGVVSYKKLSGNKKISINSKTGKVTVKGGLKKKTYSVRVKVAAAGNGNYEGGSKMVTFKVKVA